MKRIFSLLALTIMLALTAFADVRLETPTPKAKQEKTPKQLKSIDTEISIRIDRDAKEARLVIPKSQIKQLRSELAEMDDEPDATAANFSRAQTIASGVFLSLAMVFGGVWFARSRKVDLKSNKTMAVGAIVFLCGALATVAFGNIGPPLEARSITGKIFSQSVHQYKQAWGKIKLETSDTADQIVLIVPDAPQENKTTNSE